jgi:hypothetical protein
MEVAAHCTALSYTDGPLDFDVRVSPEHVTVLEMSPRLGGNCIPKLISLGTGVDLVYTALCFALGEPVKLPAQVDVVRPCGSWIFGGAQSGRLEEIVGAEELRSAVPEVLEYSLYYEIGDEIPRFIHNGNSLGHVVFDCPPQADYDNIVDRLQRYIRLKVV